MPIVPSRSLSCEPTTLRPPLDATWHLVREPSVLAELLLADDQPRRVDLPRDQGQVPVVVPARPPRELPAVVRPGRAARQARVPRPAGPPVDRLIDQP